MRGLETRIQEIRHRIFREVARMAYHTEWPVDKRIEELQKMNTTLQTINGNLLQQVSMGVDETIETKKEENKSQNKPFNMKDVFDEKGNFKV